MEGVGVERGIRTPNQTHLLAQTRFDRQRHTLTRLFLCPYQQPHTARPGRCCSILIKIKVVFEEQRTVQVLPTPSPLAPPTRTLQPYPVSFTLPLG